MYRILLADDEGIAIESLTYLIEKNYGRDCEIRSAKTGRSVIELAESFRPEIAVMDIQMPGINGIEAMKEIRRFCPETVFIVLTAYDKFDYAKEAIGLGVLDYLSKPLDRDAFLTIMNQAMKQVDRTKEKRSHDLRTREKLETVVPIIETGMLFSLLMQDTADADVNQYRELLDLHEEYGFIVLVECGEKAESAAMSNGIGTGIRIQNYYARIREILKESNEHAIVGQIMANKIPVLVPVDHPDMDYNHRTQLIARMQQVISELEERTGAGFRMGIGSVRPIGQSSASYREAQNCLRAGREPVMHTDDLPVGCEYEEGYPIEIENRIFPAVRKGQAAEAEEVADQYFQWMENTQTDHMSSIRLKTLEFVLYADHLAYLDGGKGLYRFTDRQDYMPFVMQGSLSELHRWFVDKIRSAAVAIGDKAEQNADSQIDRAKAYIDHNYQNDISLDDVSRQIGISSYYFSKLFKEEMGVTFVEYLTGIRIARAKELLEADELPIRDIGTAVGYQDPNYFSRIFKRMEGVTPSEYKTARG